MELFNINLNMMDTNGKAIERAIDISNIICRDENGNDIIPQEEIQKELINEWIQDRGNEQHETTLTLISWTLS